MRAAPAVSVVLGAAGLLVGAILFFSAGSRVDRVFPLGTAALLLAAIVAAASLAGALPRPTLGRLGLAFVGLSGAFVLWSGLSVQWSITPDDSWDYFNRDLVYLGLIVLGLVLGAVASRTAIAGGLAALLGLVIGWALLGKIVPRLFPDGGRIARLRDPIGYWNGLAVLCAVGVVLGLWLASGRSFRPLVRAGGVLLVYGATVSGVLTYSRAGVAVALLAALAWLLVGDVAFESLAALVLSVAPALGVAAFAVSLPGVAKDAESYSTRVHDGRLFGVVLVAVAVGVFGIALAAAGRPAPRPGVARFSVRAAGIAGVGAAVVLAAVVVARAGGPEPWVKTQWDAFRTEDPAIVSNQVNRFQTLSSNNRWLWWLEAWHAFRQDPLKGKGAGTFPLVNRLERKNNVAVNEPHNLALQLLSDLGIVGFLLAVGALLAGMAAAVATARRLEGVERGAAVAMTIGVAAFCLHSLVDFDWDFLAVTGPVALMLGTLAPTGAVAAVRRPVWAVGVAAFGLVAVTSLLAPWMAARRVDSAYAAIGRGAFGSAAADAENAHSLNPLSIDPLLAWGRAEWIRGDRGEAYRRYAQAVDLQPDNPDAWFALGVFQLEGLHHPRSAIASLTRSAELDPYGSDLATLLAQARKQARNARR
jgi:tetratricopeptide (TPR) repeat protein